MRSKAEDRFNRKRWAVPVAVLGSAMTIALLLIATPFTAMAQTTYEFRMAHSEAIGTPITNAFETWGKMLNERSGGRIVAKHFPAGQLGNYTQLIEGSRLGTIQATAGGPDTEEAVAPEIAVTGLGFIFKDEAHVDRVLQGKIGKEMSDIARLKTGVEFVDYPEVGFRHLLTKKPVNNLAEVKGLKLRVPELKVWVNFWKALGANPTPMAYAEQYSALSTGVIDGLEADFFSINGFKWYEQAKYLALTYHWFLPKAVRVNAKWLDSLPAGPAEVGARYGQGGLCRTTEDQPGEHHQGPGPVEGARREGRRAGRYGKMAGRHGILV